MRRYCQRTGKGEGGMLPDPESILKIKKGILHLTFQFIRNSTEYKFRFQENNFVLIGAKSGGSDANTTIEFWDINFLTKKAKHSKEPIGNGKKRIEWKELKLEKLKTLSELKRPFEWEVLPTVYL